MGWKKERVVQHNADGSRIIMVLPEDKFATKKVDQIKQIVDEDLGFVVGSKISSNSKVFLYISEDKQVTGFCLAQIISKGYRVISDEDSQQMDQAVDHTRPWCCSTEPEPAKCGINRIWVLKSERQRGIASKLLDSVRFNFIMGRPLTCEDIAFSDPTPDGKTFATKYTRTANFLVYKNA